MTEPFAPAKGVLPPSGPGIDLGAIVGGEHNDCVLVETIVLEPIQHNPGIVVHLLQCRFLKAEIGLRIAHGVVFR